MKLLLDTHLLLWAAEDIKLLPPVARRFIRDPESELLFSAASIWEVAIKSTQGKPGFDYDPRLLRRGLLDNGYIELHISSAHAVALSNLPPLHKDPFDRLLVAQAMTEGITLLTDDSLVARYPGSILKV